MAGEVNEIVAWLGAGGAGSAGILIALYKLGIIRVNGNGGRNGAMKEKLSHIASTQEKVADILIDQTTILKVQKEVIGNKLDEVVKLQEKCLDKLDDG